jgi:flagellar hook-basal body complex protein FliE
MMAMEQARLSMMAVVEVRNKLVEAYQDLSKMPV